MKSVKSLFALSAAALVVAAPIAHAAPGDTYTSAVFNDVTFSFHQDTATQLTFTISGALPSSLDSTSTWFGAQKLGAFDLKDLGISKPNRRKEAILASTLRTASSSSTVLSVGCTVSTGNLIDYRCQRMMTVTSTRV